MKQGHLAILFFIVVMGCWLEVYIAQKEYQAVVYEKEKLEQTLRYAAQITAEELTECMEEDVEVQLLTFQETFPALCEATQGIRSAGEQQEELRLHIPLLVFLTEEGGYFYYGKEKKTEAGPELSWEWSGCVPYDFYPVGSEEELRAGLSRYLENIASGLISEYNHIAANFGITYRFSVPSFMENTKENIQFPMLFAVFQGWPLSRDGKLVYENCVDVGAYIRLKERYVVTKEAGTKYPVYHKERCSYLRDYEREILAKGVSKEEALENYGAFPCTFCMKEEFFS